MDNYIPSTILCPIFIWSERLRLKLKENWEKIGIKFPQLLVLSLTSERTDDEECRRHSGLSVHVQLWNESRSYKYFSKRFSFLLWSQVYKIIQSFYWITTFQFVAHSLCLFKEVAFYLTDWNVIKSTAQYFVLAVKVCWPRFCQTFQQQHTRKYTFNFSAVTFHFTLIFYVYGLWFNLHLC